MKLQREAGACAQVQGRAKYACSTCAYTILSVVWATHCLVEADNRRDTFALEDGHVVLTAQGAVCALVTACARWATHSDELAGQDPVPVAIDDLFVVFILAEVEGRVGRGPVHDANVASPLHALCGSPCVSAIAQTWRGADHNANVSNYCTPLHLSPLQPTASMQM